MAATVALVKTLHSQDVWGSARTHRIQVTMDSSYATGGEAVDFASLGVKNLANASVFIQQRTPVCGAARYVYDYTNAKIVALCGIAEEVASTTDLSNVVLDIIIVEA